MSDTLSRLRAELIAAGQFFHSRGWVPATSSNFSARLADAEISDYQFGATQRALG